MKNFSLNVHAASICLLAGAFTLVGCEQHIVEPVPSPVLDPIANPPLTGAFELCYQKAVGGRWNIMTSGPSARNISQISGSGGEDTDPQWSPDGRYVAFLRGYSSIYVVDLIAGSERRINADSELVASHPQWTRDGQLCVVSSIWAVGRQPGTYLLKPDGSGRHKILDQTPQDIYFYDDSYRFVYCLPGGTTWYRSNLDHTVEEAVFPTTVASGQYLTVRDFNGATGDFLLNTNTIPGVTGSALATYNADSRRLTMLLAPKSGFNLSMQRYSPDHTKIVFYEQTEGGSYLSVLAAGEKKRLVALSRGSSPWMYFGSEPMQFSTAGRYVAFEEVAMDGGGWVSLAYHLYVVDVSTRGLQYIDEGLVPSWKP